MKAGDFLKKTGEHFNLQGLKCADLLPVRERLREIGYTESNVFRRLRISDIQYLHLKYMPLYLDEFLKENSPLDLAVRLFLLTCKLKPYDALMIFDRPTIDILIKTGLLEEADGRIYAPVDLYPCMGGYYATDHLFSLDFLKRTVYSLGRDSYNLARGMIRERVGSSLDLCTGSGVQAITASWFSDYVAAVDINPRALNFAKFNALLNQADNVEFFLGDLYEPVKGRKFDRVFANPPFVPAPENQILFRDGSTTGEAILQRITGGLAEHLKEEGICQIVTLLVFTGGDYNEKVHYWLQDMPCNILTLATSFADVISYILSHMDFRLDYVRYSRDLLSWYKNYTENNIQELAHGLINIAKSPAGKSSMQMLKYRIPAEDFSRHIRRILNYMEWAKSSLNLEESITRKYRINPDMDFYFRGVKSDGTKKYGMVFKEDSIFLDILFTEDEMLVVEAVAEKKMTGREILDFLKNRGRDEGVLCKALGRLASYGVLYVE